MELVGDFFGNDRTSPKQNVEKTQKSESQTRKSIKSKIIIFLLLIIGVIAALCIILSTGSKPMTYVGILKEPWPKVFADSTKGYVVPFVIKDSLGKIVVINNFIIKGSIKEVGEMYRFIKDNVDQKCFVSTEETTFNGFQRITEIAIK